MFLPLEQHQAEILRNKKAWESKPVLRKIYHKFYERIGASVDRTIFGPVVEIGSGMGQLKNFFPDAICTDLFPNPWLDLVCDGYDLPFRDESISNLILFDVFHHLERPFAFMKEALRTLKPGGRLILFEPYISIISHVAYGLGHHEPVAWNHPIHCSEEKPVVRSYYASQGNATRIFFNTTNYSLPPCWQFVKKEAFASFAYLLSGGFSKPLMYPQTVFSLISRLDETWSVMPKIFGARCLIVLQKQRWHSQ
ncbi:MAG: class I SAM-dependent methyltransferase [Verrucomicrobiales bacterium]